jgi:hypothetical protein
VLVRSIYEQCPTSLPQGLIYVGHRGRSHGHRLPHECNELASDRPPSASAKRVGYFGQDCTRCQNERFLSSKSIAHLDSLLMHGVVSIAQCDQGRSIPEYGLRQRASQARRGGGRVGAPDWEYLS